MTTTNTSPPGLGILPAGERDAITDVTGVTVGHCTLDAGAIQTGVTVVRAHGGSHFLAKVPAASVVFNGFGKSIGLMQVDELGVLETPIALTNTFSVAAVAEAQICEAISRHPAIGREWPTVNPLVFECNDGYLNDIQAMAVTPSHYDQALAAAGRDFAQGAVGAGRGMSCFGLKGGIGTASRIVPGRDGYVVGALVLSNFGRLKNLVIGGKAVGRDLAELVRSGVTTARRSGTRVRSSCCWRRMHRSMRCSCVAWHSARLLGWRARGRRWGTGAGISRWRSARHIRCRMRRECRRFPWCTHGGWTGCLMPRWRRWSRRS